MTANVNPFSAVINLTLIQGLFNMIFLLPDQVLGLIGNQGNTHEIGKESEGKIHGLFMGMGRGLQGANQAHDATKGRSGGKGGGDKPGVLPQ
jgi:hypothetical protein